MISLEQLMDDLRESLPEPELHRPIIERPDDTLYNIHKRSVPVGTDKIVLIGLTRIEADLELARLLKAETKRRENHNDVFYYFDVLPMDANVDERSIYYNECQVVQ